MSSFRLFSALKICSLLFYLLGLSVAKVPSTFNLDGVSYDVSEVIERDVAIIGGGSSGTYAAIRLMDSGKSVVLIEKEGLLGGHTNTYIDPTSGTAVEYGVQVFHNISIVTDYTSRLNVSMGLAIFSDNTPLYIDLSTGFVNTTISDLNITSGLARYIAQLEKYPYVESGFDLPDPVPEDLLLSFGDFAKKYDLDAEFMLFLQTFAQGLGDLLAHPTLYVFKNYGMGVINGIVQGYITTVPHDNSLIYQHATSILGKNVLLNSDIIHVDRSGSSVRILIKTPDGVKLINAKKLVFTIPPKIENLKGWDLSTSENSLFSQFNNSGYYSTLVSNLGIPSDVSIHNVGTNTPYGFPILPGIYAISPTMIPGLYNIGFGSPTAISDDQVKADIIAERVE